jgi:cytochrome c-type biogenesis protein
MFAETVSYPAAFLAGLLSFLSPCILPLVPAYFTFITGFSLDELTTGYSEKIRRKVFVSTLAYVLGFSFVFILMGASASLLGSWMFQYKDAIRIVGAIIIIVLGLHLMGVFRIKRLDIEKRMHLQAKPVHVFGTFLIGMAFAAGWSPCIGPLLGSILIIAGSQETVWQGVRLLSIYSAGLAIPFILISIFINLMMGFLKKASKVLAYVNIAAGLLLIAIGLLLLADKLTVLIRI